MRDSLSLLSSVDAAPLLSAAARAANKDEKPLPPSWPLPRSQSLWSPANSTLCLALTGSILLAVTAFVCGFYIGRQFEPPAAASSCLPADFVDIRSVAPDVLLDMRYTTPHNFVGRAVDGYHAPRCWLTRAAAEALALVSRDARAAGYALKVYDCYRPQTAVDAFVAWSQNTYDQLTQQEFYASVTNKSSLFPQYIATRSGHSRGSTLDLTLVALPAPPPPPPYLPGQPLVACTAPRAQRFPDLSIDMGCGFDCFDAIAHTNSSAVSSEARANRATLVALMAARGFINYADEWWHYTLAHEPYPDKYFSFPIQDSCTF